MKKKLNPGFFTVEIYMSLRTRDFIVARNQTGFVSIIFLICVKDLQSTAFKSKCIQMNYLQFILKSSENLGFSTDFRGNRS